MELTWATSRYRSYFCNGYFVKYSSDRRIVISLGSQQVADISISSSPPFPPPVRRVIFAFSKSSAVNPFLRRTCLAEVTSLVLTASHQLVAVVLIGVNPGLGLSGFFLQRCGVSS